MEKRIGWKGAAELLGIVGVIGSLVFVALEIRQNTNAVRSTTIQGVLDQAFAMNLVPVENADLREAIYSEPDELSADQRRQVAWFYAALMRVQLNRFSQAQIGVLNEDDMLELGARGGVYQLPSFRGWWATRGGRYSPEFVEFINSIVDGPPVDQEFTVDGSTQ